MSYTITKKITPVKEKFKGPFESVEDWWEVNSSYHGSKAGVILSQSWELDEDKTSMLLTLEYDTKELFERHQLREPEDYREFYNVTFILPE